MALLTMIPASETIPRTVKKPKDRLGEEQSHGDSDHTQGDRHQDHEWAPNRVELPDEQQDDEQPGDRGAWAMIEVSASPEASTSPPSSYQ